MNISCEKCGTKYRLDNSRVGQSEFKVRCHKCNYIFIVSNEISHEQTPVVLDEKKVINENDQVPDSCKTITICNQKGGVAKTSTCINLGASLALMDKRVLLIDFDVQSSLSILLGMNNTKSFYDVMHSDDEEISKCILKTDWNFWLLPSNSKMALLSKKNLGVENFEYLLRGKLDGIKKYFDYILIDTPPSGEFFTLNALMTSNIAIIPTQCEYLSMNGVEYIENMIRIVEEKTHHSMNYKILVTMLDADNAVSKVILKKFKSKYQDHLFKTTINYDQKIQESQILHSPVIHYDKGCSSGEQYQSLAMEIDKIDSAA